MNETSNGKNRKEGGEEMTKLTKKIESRKNEQESFLDAINDKKEVPDVLIALYFSNLTYMIGAIRIITRKLGFGPGDEKELITEKLRKGDMSFSNDDSKYQSIADLMSGNLDFKKRNVVEAGCFNELAKLLEDKDYKKVLGKKPCSLAADSLITMMHEQVDLCRFNAKDDESDLVYAIGRIKHKEASERTYPDLYLAFRGSVTPKDWFQNVQAPLVSIKIRSDEYTGKHYLVEQFSHKKIEIEAGLALALAKAVDDIPIKVHQGFLAYLFRSNKTADTMSDQEKDEISTNNVKDTKNGQNTSKYQSIKEDIQKLMKDKTGSVCVTGHSLGGALATLTAFLLACDVDVSADDSEKFGGFKCITFASPLVGNISFQRAFDTLRLHRERKKTTKNYQNEHQTRLRHIRFTNDRDLVPLAPPLPRYRHTAGVHVHLNHFSPWGSRKWYSSRLERPRQWFLGWLYRYIFGREECEETDRPLGVLPPDSPLAGLLGTITPFLWTVATTVPALFLPLYAALRLVYRVLFECLWYLYQLIFFIPFMCFKDLEEKKGEFWNEITKGRVVSKTLTGVVLWLLWTVLAIWPKPGWGRKFLVFGSLPLLPVVTLYLAERSLGEMIFDDEDDYTFRQTLDSMFLICIVFLQTAMQLRGPIQVLSFQTHSLKQYYSAIRANREKLYSSIIITENAKEHLFSKRGKPDIQKTQSIDEGEETEERDEEANLQN